MDMLAKKTLFGLEILNTTTDVALDALLHKGKSQTAAFLNAHCVNTAARDPSYEWALQRADHILPDGSGLQLAARLLGSGFVENLNGTDLLGPLCRKAVDRGMSIFFFGSGPSVAEAASSKVAEIAPGLEIAGTRHGFFAPKQDAEIVEEINRSGADIVLVALGVPKQDLWIARNRHLLNASLVMGVGAQFDFWSGLMPRAPVAFRKLGMEWVWRLAMEPKRMAKRYLLGNWEFVFRALQHTRTSRLVDNVGLKGGRLLDRVLSGGAILAFALPMALVVLAIKLESPGPAIFRQTRIGLDGKPFMIFKFRSMYRDAEARRAAILAQSDRSGICFKAKNDPRITRVGRILRRFSIDELPQIFNVWNGDMRIVGPRPALPQEVDAYGVEARKRLLVRPGLTGIWQVSGRAEIDFDRMVKMDNAYSRSRSLWLDLALIVLTVRAVIFGRGAY